MILVIGNKTYSSWSLRPWILMRHFEIPFEEKLIRLDTAETEQSILKFSPSGKVPALIDDGLIVWESLAIAEYLNDKFTDRKMWPKDLKARALARSVSNEMHAGFQTMRSLMSHHLKRHYPGFDWSQAKNDIERVKQIWTQCLLSSGGPFLFRDFSIADAMYAPVVNRFMTYDVPRDGLIAEYCDRIRELPSHQAWIQGAMKEDFVVQKYEKNPLI